MDAVKKDGTFGKSQTSGKRDAGMSDSQEGSGFIPAVGGVVPKPLRILLADDEPNDRMLIMRALERELGEIEVVQPTDEVTLRKALEEDTFHLVITDYRLHWSNGLEVLRQVRERDRHLPVIMFTAAGNEKIAVEGMKAGLDDYVLKQHLLRLPAAVQGVFEKYEQRRVMDEMRECFQRMFENVPIGLFRADSEGNILYLNSAGRRIFGLGEQDPPDAINAENLELKPDDRSRLQGLIERTGRFEGLEVRMRRKDGGNIWIHIDAYAVCSRRGRILGYEGAFDDITEHRRMEDGERFLSRIYRILLEHRPGKSLDRIFRLFAEKWPVDCGGLLLWNSGDAGFHYDARWVRPEIEENADELFHELYGSEGSDTMPLGTNSYAVTVMKSGEPLYVPDTANSPLWGDELRARYGLRSSFIQPLIDRDDFKALLVIQSREQDAFGKEIQVLIDHLNSTFSAVVEAWRYEQKLIETNAGLEKRVAQRTCELEVLYKLAQQFGSTVNYHELFNLLIDSLAEVVDYDAAAVLIDIDDTRELLIYHLGRLGIKAVDTARKRLMEEYCRLTGRSVHDIPIVNREVCSPGGKPIVNLGTVFKVVLTAGTDRKTVSMLLVGAEQENAFSEEQVRLLHAVANQASLAIQRLHSLMESEKQRVKTIVENVPVGVVLLSREHRVILVNQVGKEYLSVMNGSTEDDVVEKLGDVPVEDILNRASYQQRWHEIRVEKPVKRIFETVSTHIGTGPEAGGWVLVLMDVTSEREMSEKAETQARLVTIGQLAAGIAHDFNNILTPIFAYAGLYQSSPDVPEEVRQAFGIISSQVGRAAGLVQQILDYSRKSILQMTPVDLSVILREAVTMLKRTVHENISIRFEAEPGNFIVKADSTRLQQVVTNLAVNARDAMPEGGVLKITLSKIVFSETDALPFSDMPPGEWVVIHFRDTGTGIQPEHYPRIFEPFYTTKGVGEGTGLGLSQVYGIVKQFKGFIDVESEVGSGTTFTIYLPVFNPEGRLFEAHKAGDEQVKGNGETILVVEDEELVRSSVKLMLKSLNYRVLTASNGKEGLRIFDKAVDRIKAVITDIVMPGTGGMKLVQSLHERNPGIGIIVMSGYPLKDEELPVWITGWISKPISAGKLSRLIRKAIEHR